MDLKTWVKQYIESRQAVEIEEKDSMFIATFKDRVHHFRYTETLSAPSTLDDQRCTIVTINSKANIKQLVQVWDIVKMYPKLDIMFVNLSTGQKWAVFPGTHDRITEPSVLESGLLSLAQETGF